MLDMIGEYHPGDKKLQSILITNNTGSQLYLTKLSEKDNHLYRVLHRGQLNLYDENYSFNYRPSDIRITDMKVKVGNQISALSPLPVNAKKKLVDKVNLVYSTNLDAKDYTKKQLLCYLAKLD